MSKSRKILSAVLAVVMVLSVFAVSAFAYTITDTDYTQTWALGTPEKVDDNTYTVDVYLTTNYNVGPIQFKIANDNEANVTLDSVAKGDDVTFEADVECGDDVVVIVPTTTGLTTLSGIQYTNGVIATLTFKLTNTTDVANISIVNDPKGYGEDADGTLIAARMDDIVTDTAVVGQEVLSVGDSVQVGTGATAKAELVVNSGYEGIVVDTNKTLGGAYTGVIYGFTMTGANDFFTNKNKLAAQISASNGGSVVLTNSAGKTTGTKWGTGSTVQVVSADSTVEATYVVVIFGDVNGDGKVNLSDVTAASAISTTTPLAQRLAANCYQSTVKLVNFNVQTNDIMALYAVTGTGILSAQATLAAKHATNTHASYQ